MRQNKKSVIDIWVSMDELTVDRNTVVHCEWRFSRYNGVTVVDRVVMSLSDAIIASTQELRDVHNRVFPWMVADWVDLYGLSCSVRTARRYMVRLAGQGLLMRAGQRKGYLPI